jgi:osmotically-inducible protein OsmY
MRTFITIVTLSLAIFPAVASAQFSYTTQAGGSGGTQTSGAFGSRTLGGGVSNPTSSAFSSGNNTQSALGALGQSSTGQSSGQLTGNERFLRENRQGAFVGADSGDSSNVFSQLQQQQNQSFNNMFGQQGLFSQLNRLNQQNQRNQNQRSAQSKLRIPIKADSELDSQAVSTYVSAMLSERLQRLPALKHLPSIQITMQDRTAILSGRVATEREKRLVEGVALLEPGVGDVQNDLIVGLEDSKANSLPVPLEK